MFNNSLARLLLGAIVFGVAYTQAALYYSNQNQYFLHGLAGAGLGELEHDWLANTKDPAPLSSLLVTFTYRFAHESFFYVYYLLMLGLYFCALVSLFESLSGSRGLPMLIFITLLIAVHAGIVRLGSVLLLGVDYPWFFQAGVAGQYILGFGLQPSVAGVFLVVSIAAYVKDHRWRAMVWASLAGILHGTYLLPAAMLILAYMFLEWRTGRIRDAFLLGLASLLLVTPIVVYSLILFAPTSAEDFAESQRILVHERIPHHCVPARWCDWIALTQVAWIVLAIVLVRGTRLFVILLTVFSLSALLTVIQIATQYDSLALLFPWRSSSVLVPIATTVVLARLIGAAASRLDRLTPAPAICLKAGCAITCLLLAAGGVCIELFEWGYRTKHAEIPVMDFVKSQRRPGDMYLLPVEMPKAKPNERGVFSSNFTSAPTARTPGQFIPIDFQRFRLYTGTPIYVDFKSIPYKDVEVLEWQRRIDWAKDRYAVKDWRDEKVIREMSERHITHVITTADRPIDSAALQRIYADADYHVYSFTGSQAPP